MTAAPDTAEQPAATTTPASRTVGDAVVAALQSEGVPFLSAYPTTAMIDAAARSWLRPVLCRQERVGVAIADGFSRTTAGRTPGVFAMQWGPGVENAYSGMATCFADSVPVLFLPLGYESDREDNARFYSADRLRPISKSVERIRAPRDVNDVMRRAFTRLRNGRPGPVVVEIPKDLVSAPADPRMPAYVPTKSFRSRASAADTEAAVELIMTSARPVILAGQGALYAEASAELVELAELIDAPTGTTLEGKSVFPEDHDLALGAAGMSMPVPLKEMILEADLVIAVGASLTRHPMALAPPVDRAVIQVTLDEFDVGADCQVDVALIGDARLVLRDLITLLSERLKGVAATRDARSRVASIREPWLAKWRSLLTSPERPINPYRAMWELIQVLDPAESIVTHDSGSPRNQLVPFYRSTVPHGYLGWGRSHALGTGLGLVMGAKLAAPEKVCVNVMGDAAFGMVGLDFETAVRNEIPIVTVVLNNDSMAIEEESLKLAHERFGSRDIYGRYAVMAEAMGGWSRRVDHPDEVGAAFAEAVKVSKDGQAALVEVITKPQLTPFSGRAEPGDH